MTPVGALVLGVAVATSVIAWVVGGRPGVVRLGAAVAVLVEIVGATVLFFAANVLLGVMVVLGARALTSLPTSLYDASDVGLLIVSLLQAITFETIRRHRQDRSRSGT